MIINRKSIVNKFAVNNSRHLSLVRLAFCLTFGILSVMGSSCEASDGASTPKDKETPGIWVGTWGTSPQLVEPHNVPPAPGLENNTLRQVVRVSMGGEELRIRFSNEFSTGSVTMKSVQIAVSKGGSLVDATTSKELKFNKSSEITMIPGGAVYSDPIAFHLESRMEVAITICFGQTSDDITGHPGSRTTSYLLNGNAIASADFAGAVPTDHWYVINTIDVKAPKTAGTIVALGNSITDGRGSGTNKQNRWPDILAERLSKNPETKNVGVLNKGIGGNCVLSQCLGPSALDRFDRDVLQQSGVRWVILLEAVNDLGGIHDSTLTFKVANDLIDAYRQMIDKAHAKGIKVYGSTILPFGKSFYYKNYKEFARVIVNNWIRNSGRFDAVIDFDKLMRDPQNPSTLLPDVHTGDFLHPNEAGYKKMGEAIDLLLFQ